MTYLVGQVIVYSLYTRIIRKVMPDSWYFKVFFIYLFLFILLHSFVIAFNSNCLAINYMTNYSEALVLIIDDDCKLFCDCNIK